MRKEERENEGKNFTFGCAVEVTGGLNQDKFGLKVIRFSLF